MNCGYHIHNPATVSCNSCGRPLCPACDHRIKGFPYCQDCIVDGVELLREKNRANYAPYVKKSTSPGIATVLSLICPGLGAAYNGQTLKALVHFGAFAGLFQLAVMFPSPIFVFGFLGMWVFAAFDAFRTAQAIRSGVTPDVAEDILVKQFQGDPKLWGVVLAVLGGLFLVNRFIGLNGFLRFLMPLLLIGLGIFIFRGYIFKPKGRTAVAQQGPAADFAIATFPGEPAREERSDPSARFGAWRDR
ncbi:MAG: hypothetical protein KF736_07790 [Acidobacteria bacterium]|nr:hypothetical protein [Acidobacteriota bacterium]MCW5948978.1 hypothetical protein [Pyrinomonadaceae bacterium]